MMSLRTAYRVRKFLQEEGMGSATYEIWGSLDGYSLIVTHAYGRDRVRYGMAAARQLLSAYMRAEERELNGRTD